MKFLADNLIENVSVSAFEALFFEESFNEAMCQNVGLARRLVSREDDGKTLSRVVEVGPEREIPQALQRVLGQSRITYTEHIFYQWGSYRGTWHTVSSLLPEKVDARGEFSFEASGSNVRRLVSGTVSVRVFALGKMIERFVVSDTERSYAKAAAFMQTILDASKRGASPRL